MKPLLDQLMELNRQAECLLAAVNENAKRIEALRAEVAEIRAGAHPHMWHVPSPHAFVIDKGKVHQTWCEHWRHMGECNCGETSRSGDVSRPEVDGV